MRSIFSFPSHDHDGLKAGASPDGLVGDDGMVEIKCPNTATHIDTLLNEKIDRKYYLQMHFQMMCADREWCDFVSYDPRMPDGLKYWCKRVDLDEKLAEEISNEVCGFIVDLDSKVDALKEMAA